MIINIRGTNGSGKTHLVRELLGAGYTHVHLVNYAKQLKHSIKTEAVQGATRGDRIAVGSYAPGCGGMDRIPSFSIQQDAVMAATKLPGIDIVLCEGVLCSTVAGSWLDFFRGLQQPGEPVFIGYLDTPLELCLERIRERQRASARGERPIKEELVRDKVKAIAATRARFDAVGIPTFTIDHTDPVSSVREIIACH